MFGIGISGRAILMQQLGLGNGRKALFGYGEVRIKFLSYKTQTRKCAGWKDNRTALGQNRAMALLVLRRFPPIMRLRIFTMRGVFAEILESSSFPLVLKLF
jgi:hypothetical protein